MAKKFVDVVGLHNVFDVSGTQLNTSTIKESVKNEADDYSILFITADSTDSTYGYDSGSRWIWASGKLYNGNDNGILKVTMQGDTTPLKVVNRGVTIPTIAGPTGPTGADGPQGPAGADCREISEADVRAMFDNYLSDPESVTTDELVCMRKELDRLIEQREDYTDFHTPPKICGQPYVLFGAGTPQLSVVPTNWIPIEKGGYVWNGTPVALGQMYVNTNVSSGGVYIAGPSGDYDLKWINI